MKAKQKSFRRDVKRVDQEHGRYRIIAGPLNDTCLAIGYLGLKRVGHACGDTLEMAVEILKADLDDRTHQMIVRRNGGEPTLDEYTDALCALEDQINPVQRAMLLMHLRARSNTSVVPDLMTQARTRDLGQGDAQYARLGRMLSRWLDFAPSVVGMAPPLLPILAFTTAELRASDGLWLWTLRPRFVEALRIRPLEPDWAVLAPAARV